MRILAQSMNKLKLVEIAEPTREEIILLARDSYEYARKQGFKAHC